jgi:hypothetical protein
MPNDIMVTIPVGNLMDVHLILEYLLDRPAVVRAIEEEAERAGFSAGLVSLTRNTVADLLNAAKND